MAHIYSRCWLALSGGPLHLGWSSILPLPSRHSRHGQHRNPRLWQYSISQESGSAVPALGEVGPGDNVSNAFCWPAGVGKLKYVLVAKEGAPGACCTLKEGAI